MSADEKWLAANPLARYLDETGQSRQWAAERLGVATGTVTGWLDGRYTPQSEPRPHGNGNDWTMLAQLLGGGVEARWAAWTDKRPEEKDDG